MLNNEQIESLEAGLKLFNEKEFFESHEFFEELWQAAETDSEREQFLFLVRIAAAGVHLINENYSCLFLYDLALQQIKADLEINFLNMPEIQEKLQELVILLQSSSREDLSKIAQSLNFKLIFRPQNS